MKVSFIIPHKGRLEMLKETIVSILNLDYDQNQIEIIVVSQNETLPISQLVENNFNNQITVALVDEKGTISKSRNIGAAKAKGEYLAFLDADIDLSTNWLVVMLEEMNRDKQRKIVSAYQVCADDAPELEKLRTELSNAEVDENVKFLPGRNLFLHKDTFQEVGGFPEHLVTCEDYFFTDKVDELGDLFYTSKASYVHLGEDKEWDQLFHKEIWRGQSNLKSLSGRNVPLREYPSLLVPLWIFFFAITTSISVLLGHIVMSFSSVLFIALPIFLYSQRLSRMAKRKIKFGIIVKFYLVYFAARAIGTVVGLTKSFNVRNAA
jgi:glycosyltransferase involved in cell wall biosynthesis